MTEGAKPPSSAPPRVPSDALIEELTADWGFHIRSAQQLEKFASAFQAVEVHDTVPFGKLFRLDGHFMTSEKDEFFYHENLVHPAALTHSRPVRALIVGGGDGGSAEELLKHPTIESVTLAEIDGAVVDISRKYFYAVHHGALDDPRLTLEIVDGFEYVRSCSGRFDLICKRASLTIETRSLSVKRGLPEIGTVSLSRLRASARRAPTVRVASVAMMGASLLRVVGTGGSAGSYKIAPILSRRRDVCLD